MTTLRLLRIETRRNAGLWLFPVMIGLAGWIASFSLSRGTVFWAHVSIQVQYSVILLGPLTGVLGAWMAGRNHRRGTENLLKTTPYSPVSRDLVLFSSTVLWGCLAYLIAAAAASLIAYQQATWGAPHLLPLLTGLLGVIACGALGYLAGLYLPSRFTPPIVAISLMMAQLLAPALPRGGQYLTPVDGSYADIFYIFYGAQTGIGLMQAFWLLGLTGLALAAIALKSRCTLFVRGVLIASAVVAVAGAILLVQTDPRLARAEAEPLPYEPVRIETASDIPIYVHPAFQNMPPQTAAILGEIVTPLAGLPGGITRLEQTPETVQYHLGPDGTLFFQLPVTLNNSNLAYEVSRVLVNAQSDFENDAQIAVQLWLLQRTGIDTDQLVLGEAQYDEHVIEAVERFGALAEGTRRTWLEANYTALRAGELTLEDLP